MAKKKDGIYDPSLPPALPPFKNIEGDVKCDGCGGKAVINVNLPGDFVGNLCDGCRERMLPYPYNEKRE